jgi:hypothetical protein
MHSLFKEPKHILLHYPLFLAVRLGGVDDGVYAVKTRFTSQLDWVTYYVIEYMCGMVSGALVRQAPSHW